MPPNQTTATILTTLKATEAAATTITTSKKNSPKKKKIMSKAEKKEHDKMRLTTPDKKLGGLTEYDVRKLLLPDHLAEHLDVIFVSMFTRLLRFINIL